MYILIKGKIINRFLPIFVNLCSINLVNVETIFILLSHKGSFLFSWKNVLSRYLWQDTQNDLKRPEKSLCAYVLIPRKI